MPLPRPAPSCTSTWWPASTSVLTPAGTMLTRYSLSLISFGTPICIVPPPKRPLSVVVDLGLLQAPGVIDVHRLPFREYLERGRGGPFPVTVAGLPRPAERQVR